MKRKAVVGVDVKKTSVSSSSSSSSALSVLTKDDPDMKVKTNSSEAFLLKIAILLIIYLTAFLIRLFSVARYESIIHEFDPWFNFRSTKYITDEGFLNFMNWFDDRSWYPLGRHVGGTIYPGLMATAAYVHYIMNALHLTIDIRNVCVLTGPFFASNTTLVAYFFSRDVHDEATGLVAAALIAIVPGYISRSVAGSYDNEAVAIFALLLTFYLYVKAVQTGSMLFSAAAALAYFYMVAAWGGYIYITNLIPLYTLVMMIFGRYSHRLYIAYSVTYILGTLMSMQVSIVEFKPVRTPEHMAAMGVFCLIQAYGFLKYVHSKLSDSDFKQFRKLVFFAALAAGVLFSIASGYAFAWTGRLYSLINVTHARDFIPIIASVAEHQPSVWDSLFFDMHFMLFMVPAGVFYCFKPLSDGSIFLVLYGVSSLYFSSAMVRLVLVTSPGVCLLSAIAVSYVMRKYFAMMKKDATQSDMTLITVAGITLMLFFYSSHSAYVASEVYSSPSIVLQARGHGGSRIIFDDFREAYRWLSQNTHDDDVVMSWWDYGYQITGMGNRTVIADGNTRNNTHIARIGRMFSLPEEKAYPLMRELDVDYVLVIFGGMVGYSGDDINKFLWMVRISGGLYPDEIKESEYLTANGQYRVDAAAPKNMLNSLMYKLCYYKFGEHHTEPGRGPGYDRVRQVEIGNKKFDLKYLEEAYTTQHWLVRIYRVKEPRSIV